MPTIHIGDISLNVEQRGAGPPLLLVHGFPLDHTMWAGQVAALSATHRVIAPDLRGFGASGVTSGTVTMEQYADDLAALLDAMQIRHSVVLCGLSMGGYVAWQFVARHRARLERLILCDTRAAADSPDAAAGRLKTAARVLAEGAQVVAEAMLPKLFAPENLARNADFVASTREVMLQTPREGIAAALRGMAQRKDVTAELAKIDVPTLVVCGQHDGISTPAEMRQIAGAIPGAKYVEVAGAGHMAPLENPELVSAKIAEFLAN
jgi:3-oxoadipate enol-lactonase